MSASIGDILAMIDVLTEVVNSCDSMGVEEALAMHDLIGQLGSEVKRAEEMLTTAAKQHLEGGGRQIGDRMYGLKPVGKWRFRHDTLAAAIRVRALGLNETTGEMRSAAEAVDIAIGLMQAAYVTPSTEPKMGAVNLLGFEERQKVADWENTGKKIVVTDLSAPEGG